MPKKKEAVKPETKEERKKRMRNNRINGTSDPDPFAAAKVKSRGGRGRRRGRKKDGVPAQLTVATASYNAWTLYKEGNTISEIAEKLNTTPANVFKAMKKSTGETNELVSALKEVQIPLTVERIETYIIKPIIERIQVKDDVSEDGTLPGLPLRAMEVLLKAFKAEAQFLGLADKGAPGVQVNIQQNVVPAKSSLYKVALAGMQETNTGMVVESLETHKEENALVSGLDGILD